MKRGAIVTVAAGGGYGGKPRPAVIIQDDRFDEMDSVTLCLFTATLIDAPLFRIVVEPDPSNGLARQSYLMVDKIVTVPRTRLGEELGRLTEADLQRLNRAIFVFLGLAARAKKSAIKR